MALTIARSALFTVAFYLWSATVAILAIPTFLLPRPVVMRVMQIWSGGVSRLLTLICGVRVEIRGRQFMPSGPALIAAKHQCMFDVFGVFAVLPDACFVTKKELMKVPMFGWYCLKMGMIIVDREGEMAALKKLMRDGRDRLSHGRQLLIFPEGTRVAPGQAGDYKPGVAALYRDLNAPCLPLALNSGVHWPAHGFLRYPGTIVFEFLEPIPPGLKRGAFMEELERRLETASDALLAEGI
jgi:1-acyl-sn-glycerol-3-phosphate acyltransferase